VWELRAGCGAYTGIDVVLGALPSLVGSGEGYCGAGGVEGGWRSGDARRQLSIGADMLGKRAMTVR
jgi:hypothetical protein